MNFTFNHNNLNVLDLEKSLEFYEKALGLELIHKKEASDGSFILAFLSDKASTQQLELTWLRDWDRPCVCFENPDMGIYFISDPDGYWIEIIPAK